jgi:hypothetical protein
LVTPILNNSCGIEGGKGVEKGEGEGEDDVCLSLNIIALYSIVPSPFPKSLCIHI